MEKGEEEEEEKEQTGSLVWQGRGGGVERALIGQHVSQNEEGKVLKRRGQQTGQCCVP